MIDYEKLPRVIGIVGSRDFTKLRWVEHFIAKCSMDTIIVSGGAIGVDTMAELQAKKHKLRFKPFKIEEWEWKELRELVPHYAEIAYIRNELLVRWVQKYKGCVVIFAMEENGDITGGSNNVRDWCYTLNVPHVLITDRGATSGTLEGGE